MSAKYRKGDLDTVQHTAAADIAVDEVVVLGATSGKQSTVGVAMHAIATGETGSIAVKGVFEFPKTSGAVIAAGEAVNWDASTTSVDDNAATPASGDVVEFGKAMEDGIDGQTTILVEIDQTGTLT